MFVYLSRWTGYGTLATVLAISGCTKPDLYTDLRPDGPPEVLTVSVNAPDNRDGFAGTGAALEQVTFCKTQGPNDGAQGAGDSQRPDEVILSDQSALELCPTDPTKPVNEITNALPQAWYARIQFDELLNPAIEDLIPDVDAKGAPTGTFTGTLKNTQPVTLKCESATGSGMVDVPYDGYYSPSGNKVSYPVGPSLVIIPNDPTVVATASDCTVTIKPIVTDKDGNQVPADQIGPYKFRVGAIEVLAIDPPDGGKQDPAAAGVDVTFNTKVTNTSVAGDAMGPPIVDPAFAFSPTLVGANGASDNNTDPDNEYFFGGDFPAGGGPYTFTLKQGAMLIDQCGKATTLGAPSVANLTQTTFTTNALKLKGITGAIEPGNKVILSFNQYMNASTLTAADFTITPTLANPNVEYSPTDPSKLVVNGDYALNTSYTFTLNAGAAIDDCPGAEGFNNGDAACVTSPGGAGTFTAAAAQPVTFMTASAIVLKSITPKDNATESVGASAAGIVLTFNQEIVPASLTQDTDFTISPAVTLTPTNKGVTQTGSYEAIKLAGTFAPGSYTFTLLKSGSVSDKLGNTFSPTADQVIHFTVTPSAPPPTPHTCL